MLIRQPEQSSAIFPGARSLVGVCKAGRQDETRRFINTLRASCSRQIATLARDTAISPNDSLLTELRQLEKKMGLVLTLVSQDIPADLLSHPVQRFRLGDHPGDESERDGRSECSRGETAARSLEATSRRLLRGQLILLIGQAWSTGSTRVVRCIQWTFRRDPKEEVAIIRSVIHLVIRKRA